MQLSAAGWTLIASRPMDLTAFRTKSTSTSEAYLSVLSELAGSGENMSLLLEFG